tara:strand:- start:1392 stop:2291 length:900 start_codon:yes stop_codon:yes gene_type:complete
MKIAFFTEMNFIGKITRTHENMRTDFAWMVALNADHYNINLVPSKQYDLGIVIIPKKNPNFNLQKLKGICNKVAVMQEGPHWYFQDYPLEKQIWYYNTLIQSDIIFTHNESDKIYYQGLINHTDIRVIKSLMIEDSISNTYDLRDGVMMGGNFCYWYGGFDSYIVAQEFNEPIYVPSMGRKIEGEERMKNLTHLPYMNWTHWISELSKRKYAVHLMRTQAAGTFSLNCAYLGIPCIGYEGLDTQMICHPDCTVRVGDLVKAKQIAEKLRKDEEFYLYCSNKAKEKYKEYYHESKFNIGK